MNTSGLFYKFLMLKDPNSDKVVCDYCGVQATPRCYIIPRHSIFRYSCYDAILRWFKNYIRPEEEK